ncbi:MAG: ATP-dependent Clp protease proteolytic subunit, partial [Synergistaceae bacterium]|nr:ATP-dependent Clp protease proteolytic subunit [Synergistaceae bacterium]
EIQAKNIIKTKERMNRILASHTGQDYETVARDTDRDNYMTADEALKYGLIDKIIEAR